MGTNTETHSQFVVLPYSSLVVFVLLILFRDLLVFSRETERVCMGEEVRRVSEAFEEGNHNQKILHEKIYFQ